MKRARPQRPRVHRLLPAFPNPIQPNPLLKLRQPKQLKQAKRVHIHLCYHHNQTRYQDFLPRQTRLKLASLNEASKSSVCVWWRMRSRFVQDMHYFGTKYVSDKHRRVPEKNFLAARAARTYRVECPDILYIRIQSKFQI